MKKLVALAVIAVALIVAAIPAYAATRTVRVDDNVFRPDSLSVNRGDTNRRSGTVSRRLTRRGTLRLVCTIHPGMDMRIRVR